MTENTPFSAVTLALADEGTPFPARLLHRFSDLEPGDLKAVLAIWPKISLRRKLALLEDLEELAEADTLMCFDDLARSLLSDGEARIRESAIRLLWECEDNKLVPLYLEMLNGDADANVQAAAALALGLFIYKGELDELPAPRLTEVEEALLEAHKNGRTILIRRRALEALGASSRQEVPGLIESAYARRENDWVISALYAMGRSSDEKWKKQILSQIRNPEEEIRAEAIRAAGALELNSARLPLLDMLEDEEDIELRRTLIWSLSAIGGEGVRAKIEELLDAETDDEEAGFLEEALDNLLFTEDLNQFELFDFDPDDEDDEDEEEN